jgi:hypothetical protein
MNDELDMEGSGRGLILTYYPNIWLKGLRKNHEILRQDSRSPGRDLNPGIPEYEVGVLDHSTTTFGRYMYLEV